ncbi:MAG: thiamine pyrophosphate-dependent dehydrogenase E1 component subunit alpha [Solirubrobacterales bacterium]
MTEKSQVLASRPQAARKAREPRASMAQDAASLHLDLYRTMYLIRAAELLIQKHYGEDEMKTPMHMSMGEEAIAAGVCGALTPQDQVLGTYRSHGLYLARTRESDRFFAEMYGKTSGPSGGKAGSMHLFAPKSGLICTSAIVGSHIPVAIGAAFANKVAGNGRVVAVFFGDGAVDEGAFWESFNMACLRKLPILFVCEDNGYAVHIPAEQRHGYQNIRSIASQFECNVFSSETTDVYAIYELARAAKEMAAKGGPCFMHMKYYRYLEHVGVNEDFNAGYRSRVEFEAWRALDPLGVQRTRLASLVPEEQIRDLEAAIDQQVRQSKEKAQYAPFPELSALCEGVFV